MAGGFASRLVGLTGLTQHCKQCTSVVLCMNQQLLCIPSSAVILNIHVTCSQKISKSKKYHCLLPGWSQHPSLTRVILCLRSVRGNYIPLAQGVKSLSALGWQGVTIMIRGNTAQMMLLLLSLYIGNFAACLNTRIITHTTKEMSNRFSPLRTFWVFILQHGRKSSDRCTSFFCSVWGNIFHICKYEPFRVMTQEVHRIKVANSKVVKKLLKCFPGNNSFHQMWSEIQW